MNETNSSREDILKRKMTMIENGGEAWRMGDAYFAAAESEAYKALTRDELSSLLGSARLLQKENGLLCLYEDPAMPRDARVGILYNPSYAIAAAAIYAYQRYPDLFDGELSRFFHELLEGTFCRGIVGHGIDAAKTVRRTMLMLCRAGLRPFLEAHREQYPVFAEKMFRHMNEFLELGKDIDENGYVETENGFSDESINHLIKQLIAAWNGNDRPVFVYGTLMRGERAHELLSGGEYAGYFRLPDYAMYDLGSYPGIKPCAGESVLGELYFVDSSTVARLDRYEGEGQLYDRVTVNLRCGRYKTFPAEAYVYRQDVSGCTLLRESWDPSEEDLVWYAGYGSNLSGARFACYIAGGVCEENGRTYAGASDPTPPRAVCTDRYPGSLYFGNSSPSWNNCGTAFYDPSQRLGYESVYMKLYLITRGQLYDVMRQEGMSPNWYGRLVCLEVDSHGIPVYTLTSESRRPYNPPDPAYVELMRKVLEGEFRLGKREVKRYLDRCRKAE